MFIQTVIVHLRYKNASEFQGESANDFSFDENEIMEVMPMIVVAKIIFRSVTTKKSMIQ
jgi:hypothetical protein